MLHSVSSCYCTICCWLPENFESFRENYVKLNRKCSMLNTFISHKWYSVIKHVWLISSTRDRKFPLEQQSPVLLYIKMSLRTGILPEETILDKRINTSRINISSEKTHTVLGKNNRIKKFVLQK